jgi:HEAT repeat protein
MAAADSGQVLVSTEAAALLRIAEDPARDRAARARAVERVGEMREKAAVARLTKLLPGGYDIVTLAVVGALGKIGDRRTIRALEGIHRAAAADHIVIPGQIEAEIQNSIRELQRR